MPMRISTATEVRPSTSGPPILKIVCSLIAVLVGCYVFAYTNPDNLAPTVAGVVRKLFFPALVLGAALGVSSRFSAGMTRSRLQAAAWILFFAPVAVVIAYAEKSSDLFLHYEAVVLLIPFLLAAVGLVGAYRIATGRTISRAKPVSLTAGAAAMIALGVIWSPQPARDLFLPGTVIEGTVAEKLKDEKPRRAYSSAVASYQVKIEGPTRVRRVGSETVSESAPWYYTTRDVFSDLRVGDRIRAEVAAGSGILLRVHRR